MSHDALLKRIRAEFLEMPGLRLTREQMQRLCGVEETPCQRVLDLLVGMKFLCVKPNGAYARVTDRAYVPRPHPAKADLGTGKRSVDVI
jgi:DNA-binding GntR family transcriptional regulator